jgi:hypothetical protein
VIAAWILFLHNSTRRCCFSEKIRGSGEKEKLPSKGGWVMFLLMPEANWRFFHGLISDSLHRPIR